MPVRDLTSERLYVDAPLSSGAGVSLNDDAAHYLLNVLRLSPGAGLLVFNGRDGEWRCVIDTAKKRAVTLTVLERVREQETGPDIIYLFAPLKRARLDYMVQKAVEMGVSELKPVITERTIAERVNLERMRANVIEASEQCGILRIPLVLEPERLSAVLRNWRKRRLIFCDEAASGAPLDVLKTLPRHTPLAVLVGPEGGFSAGERALLKAAPCTLTVSLGPRIMRADTAAVAILALVNATLGDWT